MAYSILACPMNVNVGPTLLTYLEDSQLLLRKLRIGVRSVSPKGKERGVPNSGAFGFTLLVRGQRRAYVARADCSEKSKLSPHNITITSVSVHIKTFHYLNNHSSE